MRIIRKTWWNSQIWLCKTQVFNAEGVNVTLEVIIIWNIEHNAILPRSPKRQELNLTCLSPKSTPMHAGRPTTNK